MNANELADAMEIRASIRRKATSRKSVTEGANDRLADQLEQAANMLRQQQAEIQALKQIIDANNLSQNIGQFVKAANEPVGVVCEFEGTLVGTLFEQLPDGTKLYTHPVKELTDEEIEKIVKDNNFYWDEYGGFVDSKELLKVARAILRKAQE